jgi:hypothetical protein
MKIYRLSNRYCWLAVLNRLLLGIAVLLLVLIVQLLFLLPTSRLTWQSAELLCSIVGAFGVILTAFGALYGRIVWGSYRLTLDDDRLTQSLMTAKDVTVSRDEVTEIVERPGTSLLVRTAKRRRYIYVFEGLEEFAEFRARLAEWRPIKTLPAYSPLSATVRQAALLIPAACILLAIYSSNPYVVVISASAGTGAMVVCLWMMQRSVHVPVWVKIATWVVLAPVALMLWRIAMVCGLIK